MESKNHGTDGSGGTPERKRSRPKCTRRYPRASEVERVRAALSQEDMRIVDEIVKESGVKRYCHVKSALRALELQGRAAHAGRSWYAVEGEE